MFKTQSPDPIIRGESADRIARRISQQHDQENALNQEFGTPGHRSHLPLSLRKAVARRLADPSCYVTKEQIHLAAGDSMSLKGNFEGPKLYSGEYYYVRHDTKGSSGRGELLKFIEMTDAGGEGLEFRFRRGRDQTSTFTDSRRIFFSPADSDSMDVRLAESSLRWGGSSLSSFRF